MCIIHRKEKDKLPVKFSSMTKLKNPKKITVGNSKRAMGNWRFSSSYLVARLLQWHHRMCICFLLPRSLLLFCK